MSLTLMGQRHVRILGCLRDKIIKLNDNYATQKKLGLFRLWGCLNSKLVGAWFHFFRQNFWASSAKVCC